MRLRKDVNVYIYDPSKRFFHVVVELKNLPGALYKLLGVLRDLDLNILGSFSSAESSSKVGVWSGFVEDSNHTASELRKRILSSEYVTDATVVESTDGFLIDGIHFPLSWNSGDRAFMGRAKYIARMLRAVRNEFGTGGEKIIYDEGFAFGKDTWSEMTARIGTGFARAHLQDVLRFYQAEGWFKLESVDKDERGGVLAIRVGESFECMGAARHGHYSQFVRGHLAGALSAILGAEMECEETKCIGAEDESCEFLLMPKQHRKELVGPATAPVSAQVPGRS